MNPVMRNPMTNHILNRRKSRNSLFIKESKRQILERKETKANQARIVGRVEYKIEKKSGPQDLVLDEIATQKIPNVFYR
jgi:hypothetical protein